MSRGVQTCLVCGGQPTVYGFAKYSHRGYLLAIAEELV